MEQKLNAHTPGPWRASEGAGYVAIMAGPTIDKQLAMTMTCNAEGIANARLIAAAPEMLAALEALLSERYACESIILDAEGKPEEFDANGNWTCNSPASVAARAAIAKVRGES